jgi:methylglutaconyl-CoA hydratase
MSATNATGLIVERHGAVLSLTLDNAADGNKMSGDMFDTMLDVLRAEANVPQSRVLRIRAKGKTFCTGRERGGREAAAIRHEAARIIEVKRLLRTSSMISIAEVQGDALGFGFGMAILCDFAIVAEHVSLGFPEMKMGLAPSAIMTYLGDYALPRHAFPLVLFGDPFTPADALKIGLINETVAADALSSRADALTDRILALDETAARNCKQFFQTTLQGTFDENCRLAVDTLTVGSLGVLARANR